MNYGKGIKLARTARGISQKKLAALCKLDPSFISLIESGERKPGTETLELIAKVLRTPFHLLILLGSEKEDLKHISTKQAQALGKDLLELLIGVEIRGDRG